MSNRTLTIMDIRGLLLQLRSEASNRQIARATGLDRRTIRRYRRWAERQGLLSGLLPSLEALHELVARTLPEAQPPQTVSSVAPYQELVKQWRAEGLEVAAIHARLKEQGYPGHYMAVYRFVRRLEPHTPSVTVRVERPPGEEAQVDFGYAGRCLDPETGALRKTWVFVMTLACSRHQYAELVFDQRVATWLRLHANAFAFFGGVPRRVVLDNLKAAILKAVWDDPQVQHAYWECAAHYGFRIAPCRPRTPRHKGKSLP